MSELGRTPLDPRLAGHSVVGSTDLGKISYLLPSIHPMVKVAPDGVAIHTEDFAACSISADGDRGVLDGAKALAMTTFDLWTSADLRSRANQEWGSIVVPEGLLGS
jgi:hypothetical protein